MTRVAFAVTLAAMSMRMKMWVLALTCGCDPKPATDPKKEEVAADVKPEVTPDSVAAVKVAPARPAKPPTGKAVQLEKAPEPVRKAFWDAIQAGRKQTAAKDYAAAIASFDAALAQLPDHPRALSGRGYARLLAGELEVAEADLRRALAAPGTRKLESAIAFNLGLVAEQRGDAELARAQFGLANTLHPSKASQAKLSGGTGCPIEVRRAEPTAKLYADWKAVWQVMYDEGFLEDEAKPASEAEARRLVCTSDPLTDATAADPRHDACAVAGGPWLIRHEYGYGAHALNVIQPADGGQLRVTHLGAAGGGRCGASSDAALAGDIVTWKLTEYAPIDVMEGKDGELVDCVGDNVCFTACGEEVDATWIAYVFSPRTPDPTRVSGPLSAKGEAPASVSVDGEFLIIKGEGCDLKAPLVKP